MTPVLTDELIADTYAKQLQESYGPALRVLQRRARRAGSEGTITELRALAAVPPARAALLTRMNLRFETTRMPGGPVDELVIGAGIQAAVWCATRSRQGILPYVIDSFNTPGGIFAVAQRPVFYLNSRNRPDTEAPETGPGTRAPLNRVPNGFLQPADCDANEYQTQDVLAFVTAVNIARHAEFLRYTGCDSVTPGDDCYEILTDYVDEDIELDLKAKRVIIATGLGRDNLDDISFYGGRGQNVYSFVRFLRFIGNPDNNTPLGGWDRVAVVGDGDSANVVVESLLGQGPRLGYSSATFDTVSDITWIGQNCETREQFQRNARSRYAGIGRFMRREGRADPSYRITSVPGRCLSVEPTKEGKVKVRWRQQDGPWYSDVFDKVVLCTGFTPQLPNLSEYPEPEIVTVDRQQVARKVPGEEIYLIGPCAQLPVRPQEAARNLLLETIPANTPSLFRYTDKTAALATSLGGVPVAV